MYKTQEIRAPQMLVYGELAYPAEERTDAAGKKYTVAHVTSELNRRAAKIFVISYVEKVSETLRSVSTGEYVALTGHLTTADDNGYCIPGIIARRILSLQEQKVMK